LFSQRKGLKPIKTAIQINSMDAELRNRLWNSLESICFKEEVRLSEEFQIRLSDYNYANTLFRRLWDEYFKLPIDTMPKLFPRAYSEIRMKFFNTKWYEVYDFIEFVANVYPDEKVKQSFIRYCNSVLESEMSAYRFIDSRIAQITSKEEIAEIEEALNSLLRPVQIHLQRALDLLSDKKNPDYRNSIKESISAVESICESMTKKKTTLGQCLGEIETKIGPMHGALRRAFESLYGYTSNAEGIRHALLDEPTLDFEDAKFMLVSCSAFINYLVSKASKAGIELS
jgi:hypothetical protein